MISLHVPSPFLLLTRWIALVVFFCGAAGSGVAAVGFDLTRDAKPACSIVVAT
ncbi:MAG: hypothetical protein RLZ45_1688, partial [Verrucomicrobiota bacterium]